MTEQILAWHFVGKALRDGRPIPADGIVLKHEGEVSLCLSGLHASISPRDALSYAPGLTLCRVSLGGTIVHDTDKLVASERTIIWRADARETVLLFARQCAQDVLHLWEAPEIVRTYLETGNCAAARAAAYTAARAAADAAANAAANAAYTAAYTAARAARAAADAADAADAARAADTAYAARAAAYAAAYAAANAAADAAYTAARAAAHAAQTERLEELFNSLAA